MAEIFYNEPMPYFRITADDIHEPEILDVKPLDEGTTIVNFAGEALLRVDINGENVKLGIDKAEGRVHSLTTNLGTVSDLQESHVGEVSYNEPPLGTQIVVFDDQASKETAFIAIERHLVPPEIGVIPKPPVEHTAPMPIERRSFFRRKESA